LKEEDFPPFFVAGPGRACDWGVQCPFHGITVLKRKISWSLACGQTLACTLIGD